MENSLLSERSLAPYGKYLDAAIKSEEIRNYLKEGHPSADDILDVIYYSPSMSLEEKRDAIAGVMKDTKTFQHIIETSQHVIDTSQHVIDMYQSQEAADLLYEDMRKILGYSEESITFLNNMLDKGDEFITFLNGAMELLKMPGIFTLESVYYDDETEQQECNLEGVYSSFEDAYEEMKHWDETECWFEVRRWERDANGKMQEQGTYIIADLQPVYCHLEKCALKEIEGLEEEDPCMVTMLYMTDLNIPVPFKPGDIVITGSAPFVPRKKILITEVGDNWDCCSLQGMSIDADGRIETGAIRHGYVGYDRSGFYIFPSLLYEMKKYVGPLDEKEQILKEIADLLKD